MSKKLLFPALIALLAAFFASPFPDGLDKTAETLGFAGSGREHWTIMPDYKIPFISQPRISTTVAALAGILAVYFLFTLFAKLYRQRRENAGIPAAQGKAR